MAKKSKKKEQKKQKRQRRFIIIGVAILAIVIAIVVAIILLLSQLRQAPPEDDFTREEELANVAGDADQAIGQGNFDEGIAIYNQAIENTNDAAERAQLLADKATAFFNEERYDEALETALEAEKVNSTGMINALIAQIYEAKGDKAKAADYYARAAQQIDMSNPMAEQDRAYYESRANQLRAEQ